LHWAYVHALGSADFFLGAAIANLVRVPLYPRNARESYVHMLAHTGCRAVVMFGEVRTEDRGDPRRTARSPDQGTHRVHVLGADDPERD
jgi:hypothetical protein